jgi:SAM-dependent methyltransferase
MAEVVDLYNNVYGAFASRTEAAIRDEAAEWLRFADQVHVRDRSHVLEVGSGSGGPAVYLASARGCRVTGVDINEHGVRNGERLAAARGVADRVTFQTVDASKPLPFPTATFDAVLSNDAMCHIADRLNVLGDWCRVLRPHGRILFTDGMIITGLVSQEELASGARLGSTCSCLPERMSDSSPARASRCLVPRM